tara:strand:- start:4240 stop:5127 length:888 start_codon:yes stop_codon:yes gene_type:complete
MDMESAQASAKDELSKIENTLRAYGAGPLVNETSLSDALNYHLKSGGKRTRAKLALRCGNLAKLSCETRNAIAVSCELLHQASLLHDDLMDSDKIRRSSEAIWSLYGMPTAVCLGDDLIASAFAEISKIHKSDFSHLPTLIKRMHAAVSQTAAGQKLDCAWKEDDLVSIDEYERIVSYKTAPLLSLPFELTMDLKNEKIATFKCLKEITSAFGVAYQLLDDFEDRAADQFSQLNGYWVFMQSTKNKNTSIKMLLKRYQLHKELIEKSLSKLPKYCHETLADFLKKLSQKHEIAGL